MDSTLAGKSLAEFNDIQTKQWKENVNPQQQFLIETKVQEVSIILKNNQSQDIRKANIEFYIKELTGLSKGEKVPTPVEMELIFYYAHRLEFYGQLSAELKVNFNWFQTAIDKRAGTLTTYFGDWRGEVVKLPESTWSMWWLSDYDIEREENEEKEEKEKEKEKEKKV